MYVQLDRSSDDIPPPLQLLLVQNIRKKIIGQTFPNAKIIVKKTP